MGYNIKVMLKTNIKNILKKVGLLAFSFFISLALTLVPARGKNISVGALSSGELRSQSSGIQSQINDNNAKAEELKGQADSLRRTIDALDIEIDSSNKQIELIGLKIADLDDQLVKTQEELDKQKDMLKKTLQAMYERSDTSTFELLMASDNFTAFVNEQEYLGQLQSAVKQSTEKVIILKQQIQIQRDEQETLRKQRESELLGLESTKNERANLLSQTEGEESKYRNFVDSLVAQQAEVNRQLFLAVQLESGNGNDGGYPYNDWPFSMSPGPCLDGDGPDRWGYCTRQCVSYAAWAVERSGKSAPRNWHNANNWDDNARAEGYRVDKSPERGAVAVYNSGYYGHVQFVEDVYSNGTMRISQYNAQLTGKYSEATVASSRGDLWFIHF